MIAVDIQLARLRQPTKEAMSLRGRKNLPADSSISSSAEAPVIRGEAAARSILKKKFGHAFRPSSAFAPPLTFVVTGPTCAAKSTI
jgi:hypothetical protein